MYSPPSTAEIKERVQLYLYSPIWTFVACSRVNFVFTLYFTINLQRLTSFYKSTDLTDQAFLIHFSAKKFLTIGMCEVLLLSASEDQGED